VFAGVVHPGVVVRHSHSLLEPTLLSPYSYFARSPGNTHGTGIPMGHYIPGTISRLLKFRLESLN
jgi:hypothetical protein